MVRSLGKSVCWALIAVAALASGQVGESIRVDGAWARRALMLGGAGSGAVYLSLVNPGKHPDALLGATSDAARDVEIHESYQESGVMKMRAVGRIDVAAGDRVELKPGGYHIMLLNLTRDLDAGQVVDMKLRFQTAGAVHVTAHVR